MGWEGHLALAEALGDNRPEPAGCFTSVETSNSWALPKNTSASRSGSAPAWTITSSRIEFGTTLAATRPSGWSAKARRSPISRGLGELKKYPDIVLEIALTSCGLAKREIYRRFAIPEVWIWRHGQLEIDLLAHGSLRV